MSQPTHKISIASEFADVWQWVRTFATRHGMSISYSVLSMAREFLVDHRRQCSLCAEPSDEPAVTPE